MLLTPSLEHRQSGLTFSLSLNDKKVLLRNYRLPTLPVLEFQAMFICKGILSKGEDIFRIWVLDKRFNGERISAQSIPLQICLRFFLQVWLENLYNPSFDNTMLLIHLSYLRSRRIPSFSNKNIPL